MHHVSFYAAGGHVSHLWKEKWKNVQTAVKHRQSQQKFVPVERQTPHYRIGPYTCCTASGTNMYAYRAYSSEHIVGYLAEFGVVLEQSNRNGFMRENDS